MKFAYWFVIFCLCTLGIFILERGRTQSKSESKLYFLFNSVWIWGVCLGLYKGDSSLDQNASKVLGEKYGSCIECSVVPISNTIYSDQRFFWSLLGQLFMLWVMLVAGFHYVKLVNFSSYWEYPFWSTGVLFFSTDSLVYSNLQVWEVCWNCWGKEWGPWYYTSSPKMLPFVVLWAWNLRLCMLNSATWGIPSPTPPEGHQLTLKVVWRPNPADFTNTHISLMSVGLNILSGTWGSSVHGTYTK